MQMSEYLRFGAEGSVYGSLNGFWSTLLRKDFNVPFQRDNCAKCAANTWKKIPRPLQPSSGETREAAVSEAVGRDKDQRYVVAGTNC